MKTALRRLAPVALLATGACFATREDVQLLVLGDDLAEGFRQFRPRDTSARTQTFSSPSSVKSTRSMLPG